MKLSELCAPGRDLRGGTLVEYERGAGFTSEFGRATITRVGFSPQQPDYFEIETDGSASFGQSFDYYGDTEIVLEGGIYLWDSCLGWSYVLAPAGVEIPEASVLELRYELYRTRPPRNW